MNTQAAAGSLEGILDTVSAQHDAVPLLNLLGINGTLVVLGVPPEPTSIPNGALQSGASPFAALLSIWQLLKRPDHMQLIERVCSSVSAGFQVSPHACQGVQCQRPCLHCPQLCE